MSKAKLLEVEGKKGFYVRDSSVIVTADEIIRAGMRIQNPNCGRVRVSVDQETGKFIFRDPVTNETISTDGRQLPYRRQIKHGPRRKSRSRTSIRKLRQR